MKSAIRITAMVMSGLLLCSCAVTKPKDETSPLPVGRVLSLEVNSKLGSDMLSQSKKFAAHVEQLSDGKLVINVKADETGEQNLLQGKCDLAFLSSQEAAQADSIFSMLSLPFLYDDAAHMSLALNSEEMTGILSRKVADKNLMPMAAIYNGSPCIITDKGLLRIPADFKKLVMAIGADSAPKANAFRTLGALVSADPSQSLVQIFNEKQTVRDQNGWDLGRADAVELDLDQVPQLLEDPNRLFLIRTSHAIQPIWFMANAQSLSQLDDFEKAVLREASAGLIAGMEQIWEEKETDLIKQFKDDGITVVDAERLEFAAAVYDNEDSDDLPPYFDRQIYRTIQLFID